MSKPIIIVDYDPDWPIFFRELRDSIAMLLSDLVVVIEHVGSTSIPGCSAKPIIDMDVVIPSMTDFPQVRARLTTLGYIHEGILGIPDREAFATPPESPEHHLYVCSSQSEEYRRHILFRDYLRTHPEEIGTYSILKQRLAHQFCSDREAYTRAKSEFVAMILQQAASDT